MTNPKIPPREIPIGLDQNVEKPSAGTVVCDICGNPVYLEKCKTDEAGHAVHAVCYFERIAGRKPVKD